jgi:carboxypeptidase family protein/TonB-dependent receptor-like protein
MRRTLAVLLFVCAFAAPTLAQQSTSEVRGRAVDAQQAALPGVTITVTNQDTGIYRTTVSNADGAYFVSGLAPGMYSVAAELQGFKKYARKDLRLDLGHTTSLDVQLEIGNMTESVTVTAETPLVDVTSKQVGGNITSREMISLPSVNGNFVGMVALLPGIIANVSTESFGADAVSVNGMDSRNNNYMLDGANNNDDVIGQRASSQARVPLEAVQEFQVVTNQYDAEFGRTTGAIINAISKQGTNQWHGVAAGLFQSASLTAQDFFVKQNNLDKPDTHQQTYRANLGGPIVRDKAHFFVNLERVMIDRATTINIPSHPEFDASPVTQDRVWNTLVRFDNQLSANHTWGVRFLREYSPQLNQIIPVSATQQVTAAAAREENDRDTTIVGTFNSVLGQNRLNTVRLNYTQEDVSFGNPNFNANGHNQGALKPTLSYQTFADQQSSVAQARVDNAYEFDDTMSWFLPGHHGDHDLKFGAQYEKVDADSTANDNLNGTFTFRTDRLFDANDPSTYPERFSIRVPGVLDTTQKAHFVTAFGQDKWKVSNRATISVGLRYDVEVQPISENFNPAFSDAAKYPVDKNNFGPRVGLTYDLSGDGRSIVRGGYGRFYDKTHFELISGVLTNGVFSNSFTTTQPTNGPDPGPSNGVKPTNPFLANGPVVDPALVSQQFPAGSKIRNTGTVNLDNPDRKIPYADQITVGYERQLGPNLSVSADYVHALGRDQLMVKDLNAGLRPTTARTAAVVRTFSPTAIAYAASLGLSPFAAAINQPVNTGEVDFDSVEMALVKRFSSNYSFRVSYTIGSSRGNTSGAGAPTSGFQVLDDMRLDLNEGPTNVDRRHNLAVSGQALIPHTHGLNFSWTAHALSGSPFTLTDSTTDPDRNGTAQEPLPAGSYTGTGKNPFTVDFTSERNGATGPGFFQLDIRGGYLFHMGGQRTVNAFVDVFNVTNRANFDNPIGDRFSTSFLNLTVLRSGAVPTTLQLGVRFGF